MKRKGPGASSITRYTLRRRLYTTRELTRALAHQDLPAATASSSISSAATDQNTAAAAPTAEDMEFLRETIIRQRAEFDNFRKRTQREKEQVREFATEALLSKLLPVLDNLDRAITSADSAADIKSVREGVTMIAGQLARALEAEGLQQVKALHEPFNPSMHDALAAEERADVADGHVCEVLLPGYLYKEKLIRPAMVKVARRPAGEQTT
jgi:molecular chaperone GrpE